MPFWIFAAALEGHGLDRVPLRCLMLLSPVYFGDSYTP